MSDLDLNPKLPDGTAPNDSLRSAFFGAETGRERLSSIVSSILDLLEKHRRVGANDSGWTARAEFGRLIADYVEKEIPVPMVLPGFPCKSANSRDKVLGRLPDAGERLAIRRLEALCAEIEVVYPPGATITVVSDGTVFADVVGVPDRDVFEYGEDLSRLLRNSRVILVDLDHYFPNSTPDQQRQMLADKFGRSLESLKEDLRQNVDLRNLYVGFKRFMMADMGGVESIRRKELEKRCAEIALIMLQRSEAYSNLVESEFPRHLRLSVHPKVGSSLKLGINLIGQQDAWGTPWHNVPVLRKDGEFVLMPRRQAQGFELLFTADGRPYLFVE